MGRRRNDDFEGLISPIVVLLFFFGAAILAFLKALLLFALICGGVALIGFVVYRVGQNLWSRQLYIEDYLPRIDWSLPTTPAFDSSWLIVRYPEFPALNATPVANVIGTSGAWKDVVSRMERFVVLRGASGPRDLQQRLATCEAAAPKILCQCLTEATELARQKQEVLNQQVKHRTELENELERRVRPELHMLRDTIEAMQSGGFFDKLRAKQLAARLAEYEFQLRNRCRDAKERADREAQAVNRFLDPAQREIIIQDRLKLDFAAMKEIVNSKEFAGAAAEMAVIDELSALPAGCLIFNDVKLESGRYIHFEGKPLMSAQIDTLVLTPSGVFVIEVKNWSREFAQSGQGFSPYEQASRASYLVFDRLRRAGVGTKVRAVIATNGSLPNRGDHKVAVVPIGRLRAYIEGAPPSHVNVEIVRSVLRL